MVHPCVPGREHGVPQGSRLKDRKREWCGRRDLNPHELLGSTDFHTVYGFRRLDAALRSACAKFAVWTRVSRLLGSLQPQLPGAS
jgi:hypothetical protein